MWLRIERPDLPMHEGSEAVLERNGKRVPLEVLDVEDSSALQATSVIRRYSASGQSVPTNGEDWHKGPVVAAAISVTTAVAIAWVARLSGFRLPRRFLAAVEADGLGRTL
jgi:hypothetical protein